MCLKQVSNFGSIGVEPSSFGWKSSAASSLWVTLSDNNSIHIKINSNLGYLFKYEKESLL